MDKPNVLFIMCDQFRYDMIAALGNPDIHTPNLDRLVRRGISLTQAYSPCPVCVPARYIIRTGRTAAATGCFLNEMPCAPAGQAEGMEDRCGPYLARTMLGLGYRTFGIGKFHTVPDMFEDLGYETHIHTEELWPDQEARRRDGYARFIHDQHPAFRFIEQLHGERTNLYYIPQMSPLPAELTVEAYTADQAVAQISGPQADCRPYFGFVSFVGPHPPCAPPIPFNRLYNPDMMPDPVKGPPETDLCDEQIPWMNYLIWADDINDSLARNLKSRYYGEITYIDDCLGRILDAVEASGKADNTLICFFADHGDHLGDHRAWQKESFFEAACRIPFLLSWPCRLQPSARNAMLTELTDLFALATGAAGSCQTRDGIDLLTALTDPSRQRQVLYGVYGRPGTRLFKIMVRAGDWKYIWLANGSRQLLFNLKQDPGEMANLAAAAADVASQMHRLAGQYCEAPGLQAALTDGRLQGFPFLARPLIRIHQFDTSQGITGFGQK